jgi:hypothetical protein
MPVGLVLRIVGDAARLAALHAKVLGMFTFYLGQPQPLPQGLGNPD